MTPPFQTPRIAIGALGVLMVAVGFAVSGELLFGFSYSPGSFLVHAGLYALLVAVTSRFVDRLSLDLSLHAVSTAILAFALFFVVAIAMVYVDLVILPPYSSNDPTFGEIVMGRSPFVLSFTPLVGGYALGGCVAAGDRVHSALAVLVAASGVLLGYELVVLRGGHPDFALILFNLLGVAGLVAGTAIYLLSRQEYGFERRFDRQDQLADD